MSITSVKKNEIIKSFGKSETDTGSAPVQIAILTERIKNISNHLKAHHKDCHSRHGLFKLVGARKSLFNYLKNNNPKLCIEIANKLGLKS